MRLYTTLACDFVAKLCWISILYTPIKWLLKWLFQFIQGYGICIYIYIHVYGYKVSIELYTGDENSIKIDDLVVANDKGKLHICSLVHGSIDPENSVFSSN